MCFNENHALRRVACREFWASTGMRARKYFPFPVLPPFPFCTWTQATNRSTIVCRTDWRLIEGFLALIIFKMSSMHVTVFSEKFIYLNYCALLFALFFRSCSTFIQEKDAIIVKFNKRHCIIDKVWYFTSHKSHAFEELLPFFRAGLWATRNISLDSVFNGEICSCYYKQDLPLQSCEPRIIAHHLYSEKRCHLFTFIWRARDSAMQA